MLALNLWLFSQDAQKPGMKLHKRFHVGRRRGARVIVEESHLSPEKRALLIQLHDFETPPPLGLNIQAPVLILLEDVDDRGAATDLRQRIFSGPDQTERQFLFDAFGDHLAIARLKDMQWHKRAGKHHDVERKKREQAHRDILQRFGAATSE